MKVISTGRFSSSVLFVFFVLLMLLGATPAPAQQRYRQWGNPDGGQTGSGQTQKFVDRLNRMVDEAEKSRAADPRFLRDLRGLARSFNRPLRRRIFFDDFLDGNFTTNPVWTVTAGRYWVEKGWGLRSDLPPGQAVAQSAAKRLRGRDAAIAILGAVLGQAAGNRGGENAPAPTTAPAVATIQARVQITNAFAIEFELSSWRDKGQSQSPNQGRNQGQTGKFEIGPYQGNGADVGYRLTYRPGGTFELLRVSARGTSIIDAASAAALEDRKPHTIKWSRLADGVMTVKVDGKQILFATDRGIRQGFGGIQITNRGGDYIVKRITIYGAN